MDSHLRALATLVTAMGLPLYDSIAERPSYNPKDWAAEWNEQQQDAWKLETPYAVLSSPPVFAEDARTLSRESLDVADEFDVTVTGLDPREVRHWAALVKTALDRGRPQVEGFSTWVRFLESSRIYSDRTVPLAGPVYLCYAVQTYRLDSTPIAYNPLA